jgi:hypothetical protein
MHRSVLENEDFIAWANENVVVLVGNENGSGKHETGEKSGDKKDDDKKGIAKPDEDGGGEPPKEPAGETAPEPASSEPAADVPCTYYPGIKCSEHVQACRDVRKPPEGGAPEIPEWKGIPASFLITPDGNVADCKADRAPSSLQKEIEELSKEKKLKTLAFKKYEGYLKAIADGDEAVEASKWKAALAAYAKVDKDAKKVPGVAARLPKRLEAMNAKVVEAFEKAKAEGDAAAKLKAVKALRADVAAKLSTGALPVVADLDAWIKENAAPAK